MLYLYLKLCRSKSPENLTFRHIVAGPVCETHRLSNLSDILLQPYTKYVKKSYIKDTKDYLQELPNEIDKNSILVVFDVENLYSNIPHDLGLEAIIFWINKYPNELPSRISKEFVSMIYISSKPKAQPWEPNMPLSMQH